MDLARGGPCAVCSTNCHNACKKCSIVFYCSKEHQTEDWEQHKNRCMPICVKTHRDFTDGRKVVVVKKDIEEGQLIFINRPIIVFPQLPEIEGETPETELMNVCMGCCRVIEQQPGAPRSRCTNCRLPICGQACQAEPYHSQLECNVIATVCGMIYNFNHGDAETHYFLLTILRALLLRDTFPDKWEQLLSLPGPTEEEQHVSPEEAVTNDHVITIIQRKFGQTQFSRDTIKKVHFQLVKNLKSDFKLRSCNRLDWFKSSIPQSCQNNTVSFYIGTQGKRPQRLERLVTEFYATRPISKGEYLTLPISSTPIKDGTLERRSILLESCNYFCACPMCSDPTELDTYYSAIKCSACVAGGDTTVGLEAGYLLAINPLDPASDWKCCKCTSSQSSDRVIRLLHMYKAVQKSEKDKLIGKANDSVTSVAQIISAAVTESRHLTPKELKLYESYSASLLNGVRQFGTKTTKLMLRSFHPNHHLIIQAQVFYATGLFVYLSLNREEWIVPSFMCLGSCMFAMKNMKTFNGYPKDWLEINRELCEKSEELLELLLKLHSEISLVCGRLIFFISFSKLMLLKYKAKEEQNFDAFLEDLSDWLPHKQKAESIFQKLIKYTDDYQYEHSVEDVAEIQSYIQSLENMNFLDPTKHPDDDKRAIYNTLISETTEIFLEQLRKLRLDTARANAQAYNTEF